MAYEWIDIGVSNYKFAEQQRERIRTFAEQVLDNFFAQARLMIDYARAKGIPVSTTRNNHSEREITMHLKSVEGGDASRILTIGLSDDRLLLLTGWDENQGINFVLAVLQDGTVGVKRDQDPVPLEDAVAEVIAEFLFAGESPYTPNIYP